MKACPRSPAADALMMEAEFVALIKAMTEEQFYRFCDEVKPYLLKAKPDDKANGEIIR